MKFLWFVLAVVALGMAGLYGWYGSLHPCDMLTKDLVRARVAADADLGDILRGVVAPVRMTPGECVQALARLHISPKESGRLRGGPAATSGTAGSEAEQLRAIRKAYQDLLNPPTTGDAPENEPGYNSRMRDEMRRAIEGIGKSDKESQ